MPLGDITNAVDINNVHRQNSCDSVENDLSHFQPNQHGSKQIYQVGEGMSENSKADAQFDDVLSVVSGVRRDASFQTQGRVAETLMRKMGDNVEADSHGMLSLISFMSGVSGAPSLSLRPHGRSETVSTSVFTVGVGRSGAKKSPKFWQTNKGPMRIMDKVMKTAWNQDNSNDADGFISFPLPPPRKRKDNELLRDFLITRVQSEVFIPVVE